MKNTINIFISFIIAFLLISIFAIEISPFYTEPPTNDSAVFFLTGKYWMQGYLPYRDLWELKGPLIFLYNGLGYLLTRSLLGVYFLQLLVVTISTYLTYRFLRLELSHFYSWLITILIYIQSSCLGLGANNLETFILPFLLLSFYFVYLWTNQVSNGEDASHRPLYALLYGFVLGFSLMSRLTNAVGICAAVAVIGITLIYKGKWKNLGYNIIAFICGFAFIVLPFVIYFEYHGLQYEMWYGSFLFGLEYAGSSGFDFLSVKGLANIALRFVDNYLLIGVSLLLLLFSKGRRLAGVMWLVVSLTTFAWFLHSNGFEHYIIIALPYACISFIELHKLYEEKKTVWWNRLSKFVIVIYSVLAVVGCIYTIWLFKTLYSENTELIEIRTLTKDLPQDYKESFAVYNTSPQIYVYDDIRPAVKFHSLQDFVINMGPSLNPQVKYEFLQKKPEWLLVKGKRTKIDDIIQANYQKIKKEGFLTLYKHK